MRSRLLNRQDWWDLRGRALRNRVLRTDGPDRPDRPGDQGISTIEVVILAPVMILFILVLVAFGQLVDGRGAVDGAARDAARAGSLQRNGGTAMSQAQAAAEADLKDTCIGHPTVTKTSAGFEAGKTFAVEVSCKIRGFGILGLDITNTITARSASPLDPYRRAAP